MALEIASNPLSIERVAEQLALTFGDAVEDVRVQEPDTVVARCRAAGLRDLALRLKADTAVGYETLNWIAGVDRKTNLETVYHLYSWKTNTYLQLHVGLPVPAEVETVCDLWPSAEWLEREAWDMFGIRFAGHPDLRRILLKDDFVGHPLRKDYVDLAENHPHV
jgi:NADH:ubiquinone oxidoreductase subunit C